MNKFARISFRPAAIGSALFSLACAARAAVPAEVDAELTNLKTDALKVAGIVLAAIVAIYAFKFIRKGL